MDIQERAKTWLKEPPPDNGEPEPSEIAEAREIIELLLNECRENDLSFSASMQNIDRKYARIKLLGSAIFKGIERIEEINRRDGGSEWRKAKDLLKSDLNLILSGLQAAYPESI
ncbi:MAG: hypothetical protein ACYC09_14965 [Bacteroidota bacterium]